MFTSWIRSYWGKARPIGPVLWHPLAYHSLDVAAAMAALLEVRPHLVRAIAMASALSLAEVKRRLVLVAAFHDLGKFAPNFQQKVPELSAELRPGTTLSMDSKGHGQVGALMWRRWPGRNKALDTWHHAAASHHGVPVELARGTEEIDITDAIPRSDPADGDACAFTDAVLDLIGPPTDQRDRGAIEVWRVAGLVMLADWIGSNQAWFPYTEPKVSLPEYWAIAQRQAHAAVCRAGLGEAAPAPTFELSTFLGADALASPLQRWAEAQQPGDEPQLYVIEDLTGAGKTEAALILAHRLMAAGAAEGLYWALPTTATANALYARLAVQYQTLLGTPGSLVLAHSGRDMHEGFQASIGRDRHRYDDGDSAESISAEAACSAFIAEDRKKTFLAQIGVGTLDQALLAILPNRHQAVRLAAVSRRILVVDEAHAYGPYQERMLRDLLSFHRALGGSAIVLSATLTQNLRLKLAKIYHPARGCALNDMSFPLATHVTPNRIVEAPQRSVRGARRDLPVHRLDTPEATMDLMIAGARQGACGVYVRNTVKDVLAALAYFRAHAVDGISVDIFHARYALGDRLARESEAVARFGRHSSEAERRGRILVASQVVEQSLDLDFDMMASDLCPMDLLIQRAGRLHRHDRLGRAAPELWLVGPPAEDEVAADWYGARFPAAQFVYPHTEFLWRTMRVLNRQGGLNLANQSPRDFIEPVFGADPIPYPAALERAAIKSEGTDDAHRGVARLNALRPGEFSPQAGAWGSDIATPTRLSDPTITLRLARWVNGTLHPWIDDASDYHAWRLSEITVRAARFDSAEPPDAAASAAIEAAQASWRMRYEPPPILALTPAADDGVWQGAWCDKRGRRLTARYDAKSGLIVE